MVGLIYSSIIFLTTEIFYFVHKVDLILKVSVILNFKHSILLCLYLLIFDYSSFPLFVAIYYFQSIIFEMSHSRRFFCDIVPSCFNSAHNLTLFPPPLCCPFFILLLSAVGNSVLLNKLSVIENGLYLRAKDVNSMLMCCTTWN